MLQAILRGKFSREQQNMEDVLTSNVFGLLRYIPAKTGLFRLLAESKGLDRTHPLRQLLESLVAEGVIVSSDDYQFWPLLHQPECKLCEPDVLIRVRRTAGRNLLILVEAKYQSPKSSKANDIDSPPNDQLAREWDNLVKMADAEGAEPYLIFLTSSTDVPAVEILDSIAEYRQKRSSDNRIPSILALSWRDVAKVFQSSDESILRDLCALATRLGLRYFSGFRVRPFQQCKWRFDSPERFPSSNRKRP